MCRASCGYYNRLLQAAQLNGAERRDFILPFWVCVFILEHELRSSSTAWTCFFQWSHSMIVLSCVWVFLNIICMIKHWHWPTRCIIFITVPVWKYIFKGIKNAGKKCCSVFVFGQLRITPRSTVIVIAEETACACFCCSNYWTIEGSIDPKVSHLHQRVEKCGWTFSAFWPIAVSLSKCVSSKQEPCCFVFFKPHLTNSVTCCVLWRWVTGFLFAQCQVILSVMMTQ